MPQSFHPQERTPVPVEWQAGWGPEWVRTDCRRGISRFHAGTGYKESLESWGSAV
jgi:hypothetical protein